MNAKTWQACLLVIRPGFLAERPGPCASIISLISDTNLQVTTSLPRFFSFTAASKLGYKFSLSRLTPRLASTDELILTRSSVPLISAAKKMHPYNHKKVCKSYKNHTRTKHGARVTIICRSRANLQYRHHDHWECSAAMNMADDLVNIWTLLFL